MTDKKKPRKCSKTFARTLRRATGVGLASAALLLSTSASAQNVYNSGQMPDYHVVQEGDTLYDLAGGYYGDVYEWPRLWSYNPHVTNPHWIYPGDIVYLRSPETGETAPGVDEGVSDAGNGELHLPVGGMILKDRLEYVGRITASPKEANMLSPHDVAWVGFGEEAYGEKDETPKDERRPMKDGEAQVGDVYAIVREAGELENSDGDFIGHKYLVVGTLEITETSEKYYDTARILQSWIEVYRGDYLIPYERQLQTVAPVKSDQDMVAEIVDGLQALFDYGESYYVFVNKGAADGVRPGNRFFVYQRSEGLDFGDAPDDEIPWRRVGQVMVIDTTEAFSIAVITDSKREIAIGDRLEMYAGY